MIEKSEVSTYTIGVLDSTVVTENLGTFNLQDDQHSDPTYNICYFDLVPGYWPAGFGELASTLTRQNGPCKWYGDLRARDRITFWEKGGFAAADLIFVIYTRLKNAYGPGKKEQWMYLKLDANGNFLTKEILYLKLENASGKPA